VANLGWATTTRNTGVSSMRILIPTCGRQVCLASVIHPSAHFRHGLTPKGRQDEVGQNQGSGKVCRAPNERDSWGVTERNGVEADGDTSGVIGRIDTSI